MITAVDTNVILDVVQKDEKYFKKSSKLLKNSFDHGSLIISEIVYAELSASFNEKDELEYLLKTLNIKVIQMPIEGYYLAGRLTRKYFERKNKKGRPRILSDFIIGVHAMLNADRLLTRDRGFYRDYFNKLVILQ